MTVSISNMAQVWMSNTNTYNGIAMSISTLGYGANVASRILSFRVDGNTKFALDGNGNIVTCNSINAFAITSNTISFNKSTANVIYANVYATFLSTSNSSFANLPNANTVGAGSRAFVFDATTTTFASSVIGGGANRVPVYSNGRNWLIG